MSRSPRLLRVNAPMAVIIFGLWLSSGDVDTRCVTALEEQRKQEAPTENYNKKFWPSSQSSNSLQIVLGIVLGGQLSPHWLTSGRCSECYLPYPATSPDTDGCFELS
jgi:hypothetical protein